MEKYSFSLLTLVLYMLSACTESYDIVSEGNGDVTRLVLTPEEYASVAYDNPQELSEDDILDVISDFRCIKAQYQGDSNTKSARSVVAIDFKKSYISNRQEGENAICRFAKEQQFEIPIYEVTLVGDDGGNDLAVVCGDERAPKVLFYAGNLNHSMTMADQMGIRYLIEVSKKSIASDIGLIESTKSSLREATLNKISSEFNIPRSEITKKIIEEKVTTEDFIATKANNPIGGFSTPPSRILSMVTPMSHISWDQGKPYNNQIPICDMLEYGRFYQDNGPVGCANIAVATLFSILRPTMTGRTDSGKQVLIDWDYLTSSKYISSNSPLKMREMAGALLRTIFDETHSTFLYKDEVLYDEDENEIPVRVVKETSVTVQNMLTYIKSKANFKGATKFDANSVLQSLQNQRPVLLFGSGHYIDSNYQYLDEQEYGVPRHAWLIDGYCMTRKSGQTKNDQYWSVNMGWGLGSSHVYFKTEENFQNCDVVFWATATTNVVYYTQEQSMICDIVNK